MNEKIKQYIQQVNDINNNRKQPYYPSFVNLIKLTEQLGDNYKYRFTYNNHHINALVKISKLHTISFDCFLNEIQFTEYIIENGALRVHMGHFEL